MALNRIFKLTGNVQHYAWGGYEFIPDLLGLDKTASNAPGEQKPYAELWLGAHPKAPSVLTSNGDPEPLDAFIRQRPEAVLGARTAKRFGNTLPFLFKVLDARDMLSIQAHPSKKQAEAGFARENGAGIKLDADNRSYKDDNHKPEVHVALTDFWLLHGFRPAKEIEQILKNTTEFRSLLSVFYADGLAGLYKHIMQLPQDKVDAVLEPLAKRLTAENPQDMDAPDYWALKAFDTFPLPDGQRDRGIFSIYLLNLLHLAPGEGTFQDAGVLHAYLSGANMELMANSDNVLRGGLTPKYVDVDELLKTVIFEGNKPEILTGTVVSFAERVYKTPAPDFELSKITLYDGENINYSDPAGPEIVLVLSGAVSVLTMDKEISCRRGEAFFVPAHVSYTIQAGQNSVLFRAKVPVLTNP